MMNSTTPVSNDGTITKMFDRVLEKEFSDNNQPQGLMEMVSWKQVWNALKILDATDVDNPESSPGIVELYSLKVIAKSLAGKPEGWNREHLWPRSYGLRKGPLMTDIHNICPADVNAKNEMGLLSTLLKLNEIGPPSGEEKLRNDRVCKLYQLDLPSFCRQL